MRNTPSTIDELDTLAITTYEEKILRVISIQAHNITEIAKLTKIPRTSLLYIIRKLRRRNLVKVLRRGKRTFYKSDFHQTLKQLGSIHTDPTSTNKSDYNHAQNGVIVYEDIEAVMNVFERLSNQPRGSRIYGIQPDNSIKFALRKTSVDNWARINNAFKQKEFIFEGIVHEKSVSTIITEVGKEKAVDIFDSFIGRLEDYVKIPDEFANVEAEMYIFGNSAFIINWNKEIAIEIVDKNMVALLLALFSCTKELGQRYSQNQKMEQYAKAITPPNKPQ